MENLTPGMVLQVYFGEGLIDEKDLSKNERKLLEKNDLLEYFDTSRWIYIKDNTYHAFKKAKQDPNNQLISTGFRSDLPSETIDLMKKTVLVYEHLKQQLEGKEIVSEDQYPMIIGGAFKQTWPTFKDWQSDYDRMINMDLTNIAGFFSGKTRVKKMIQVERVSDKLKTKTYEKVEALYK